MVPYITKFLDTLTASRAKYVRQILNQMRDRGEIRSIEEFRERVSGLSSILQGKSSPMTPQLLFKEGDLIESNSLQTFFSSLRGDLQILLSETEELSNKVRGHRTLLSESYFQTLADSVENLLSVVISYEALVLGRSIFGYTIALYDFTQSLPESLDSSLGLDIRTGESLLLSRPVFPSKGVGLSSSSLGTYRKRFTTANILTSSTTPETEYNADIPRPLSNIIDGNSNTNWKRTILLSNYHPNCQLALSLIFPLLTRIQGIVINPISDHPMRIASGTYTDSSGHSHSLNIGTGSSRTRNGFLGEVSQSWILSEGSQEIPVGDIEAKSISLVFQQDSASDFQAHLTSANGQTTSLVDGSTLRNYSAESGILAPLGVVSQGTSRSVSYKAYSFGFRDIYAVSRSYRNSGYFTPASVEKNALKTLGLSVEADLSEDKVAVEFVLCKEDFDSENSLLKAKTFPLCPYGWSSIVESLPLTQRTLSLTIPDSGFIRMYPNFSSLFNIIRNGEPLVIGRDYEISVDGGTTWESVIPPVTTPSLPQKCMVRILSVAPTSLYGVEYLPLTSDLSNSVGVFLDNERSIKLGKNFQIIFLDRILPVKSRLSLCTIVKRLVPGSNSSSFIRKALLTGMWGSDE